MSPLEVLCDHAVEEIMAPMYEILRTHKVDAPTSSDIGTQKEAFKQELDVAFRAVLMRVLEFRQKENTKDLVLAVIASLMGIFQELAAKYPEFVSKQSVLEVVQTARNQKLPERYAQS